MNLAQDAYFSDLISSWLAVLVVLPLVVLVAVSLIGLPVLLITKWGHWRLLLSVLAPTAIVATALTFASQFLLNGSEASSVGLRNDLDFVSQIGPILSIGLFLTCAGVGLAALIDKKRWGVLAGLVGTPVLLLTVLVGLRMYEMSQAREVASAVVVSTTASRASEVERSEWLAAANSEPRIELEKEVDSADDTDPPTEEPTEGLPDWIEAKLKPHDRVFVAGPYATQAQCEADLREQMLAWLCQQAGVEPPNPVTPACDELLDDSLRKTHLSKRDTSVGEVYLKYARIHAADEVLQRVRRVGVTQPAEAKRQSGVNAVALGGGALLGAIGLLHLALRGGGKPQAEKGA